MNLVSNFHYLHKLFTRRDISNDFSLYICRLLFYYNLVDIPLFKMDHPMFKAFISRYTEHKMPHSSTVRKTLVDKTFEHCLNSVRKKLTDEPIYVSLDGTTDISKRNVASFIAGSLKDPNNGPYVINMQELEESDSAAYLEFFEKSIEMLYVGKGRSLRAQAMIFC